MKKRGVLLASILSSTSVFGSETSTTDWNDPVTYFTLTTFIVAFILVLLVVKKHPIKNQQKKVVFLLLAIPILLATGYGAGYAIYDTVTSISKGPVHWHADYEVWVCGEKLDLINPPLFNNKIGTVLIHERNDDRIHIQGSIHSWDNVDLDAFFTAIGGSLSNSALSYPTSQGIIDKKTGDFCDGKSGQLATYVNGARIADVSKYVISHETQVPPGDCIIVEFGTDLTQRTNRICDSWKATGAMYERGEN